MIQMPIQLFKWEPEEGVMEKQGKLKCDIFELANRLPAPRGGPVDLPHQLIVFNNQTKRAVTFQQRAFRMDCYYSLDKEYLIEIIFQ